MGWGGRCPAGPASAVGFLRSPLFPIPPGSLRSPDPASVNSRCFSAGPRSRVLRKQGNGTETEMEAPSAKGGLGTA